jgi:hypothetical protein
MMLSEARLVGPAAGCAGYHAWHLASQRHKEALQRKEPQAAELHCKVLRLLLEGVRTAHNLEQQQLQQAGGGATKKKRGSSTQGAARGGAGSSSGGGAAVLQLFHPDSKHYNAKLLETVCGELGIELLVAAGGRSW